MIYPPAGTILLIPFLMLIVYAKNLNYQILFDSLERLCCVKENAAGVMWVNHKLSGKPGASNTYSDTAIECILTLKTVYNLALHSTEGLMQSVVNLLRVELPVPDYTTLCRRSKVLDVKLPRQIKGEPIHIEEVL
jgi:hypothetical protein